jgi:hypothetical protein
MKNLIILVVFIGLFGQSAIADEAADYAKAYKNCSPIADQLSKQQCNYGYSFEDFYNGCMKKYGYSDASMSDSKEFYEGYLKAYKYCSADANAQAKKSCNYGDLYHKNYNKCMIGYGFNSAGEKIQKKSGGGEKEEYFRFDF